MHFLLNGIPLRPPGLDVAGYASCRRQCVVRLPRALLCANPSHTTVYNTQLTFWSYLVLRITFAIVIGGAFNELF